MNTGFLGPAVATVLTVYGIETFYFEEKCVIIHIGCNSTYRLRYWNSITQNALFDLICPLQQYLPFTVLKPFRDMHLLWLLIELQQYLPFTVLKHFVATKDKAFNPFVATVLTVYGIETFIRILCK